MTLKDSSLDFGHPLESGLCFVPRRARFFPEQRLIIEFRNILARLTVSHVTQSIVPLHYPGKKVLRVLQYLAGVPQRVMIG